MVLYLIDLAVLMISLWINRKNVKKKTSKNTHTHTHKKKEQQKTKTKQKANKHALQCFLKYHYDKQFL